MDAIVVVNDDDQKVSNINVIQTQNIQLIFSSKENKFIPSDQKILIDSIAKFQTGLEKVDAHDHIMMPPLYRQVNT